MRAFNDPLTPSLDEIGVDKLRLRVKGNWSAAGRGSSEFRDYLCRSDPSIPWFRTPQRSANGLVISTLEQHAATVDVELKIYGFDREGGTINATLDCNPTRTLAHLLKRCTDSVTFQATIQSLPSAEFFARTEGYFRRSLGGGDNWIEDSDQAQAALGQDIFATFLPIFAEKLYELLAQIVAPGPDIPAEIAGTDLLMHSVDCRVRLIGDTASIPQIETYFERHYTGAGDVIRMVAQEVLACLDHAEVRHHLPRMSFGREGDLFSISTDIPNERRLGMYAKWFNRIRFEVRRLKRGRYTNRPRSRPEDRLLNRLADERENALTACDWAAVGRLFAERPQAGLTDFVALVGEVVSTCQRHGADANPVLTMLLRDGGMVRTSVDTPERTRLIRDLQRSGILERQSLRRRDVSEATRRIGLAPIPMAVFQKLLSTFSGEPDQDE